MAAWMWILVAVTTLWSIVAIVSVWRVRSRKTRISHPPLAISVLKPLCGVDEDLEPNLRSFFEQDHESFELVFGIEGANDPAIAVASRLCEEYSSVPSRIVVHQGGFGINPKMSNLRAMLSHATHDVVVVSDSNVRAEKHYLRELSRTFSEPGVGLVTNLFAGVGECSVGATLENLHLNSTVASGIAASNELFAHPAVVGKSMMFRRSTLEKLGGFDTLKDILAEDYVIGRMFHEAGLSVRLTATPLRNVVRQVSIKSFMQRQLRWGMIRVRLVPIPFLLEPLTMPIVVAGIGVALGAAAWPLVMWAVALTVVRDAVTWMILRGTRGLARALPLVFLRDFLILIAWAAVPFFRHVTWRGKRVRVSAGTRLYREAQPT